MTRHLAHCCPSNFGALLHTILTSYNNQFRAPPSITPFCSYIQLDRILSVPRFRFSCTFSNCLSWCDLVLESPRTKFQTPLTTTLLVTSMSIIYRAQVVVKLILKYSFLSLLLFFEDPYLFFHEHPSFAKLRSTFGPHSRVILTQESPQLPRWHAVNIDFLSFLFNNRFPTPLIASLYI